MALGRLHGRGRCRNACGQAARPEEGARDLAAPARGGASGLETARARLVERQDSTRAALAAERRAREEAREAFAALNAAREAETRLAQRAQQQSARLATLAESAAQLALDLAEAERQAAETEAALAALPDLGCRAPASRGLPRAPRRDAPAPARAAKCQRPPARRGGGAARAPQGQRARAARLGAPHRGRRASTLGARRAQRLPQSASKASLPRVRPRSRQDGARCSTASPRPR